jgi:hypothetical protein
MSSVDIPFTTTLTTSETVSRIPRMQACPPIAAGSNVIRSNTGLVYRPEGGRKPCESAGACVRSGIRTSEVKRFVTSDLAKRTSHGRLPISRFVWCRQSRFNRGADGAQNLRLHGLASASEPNGSRNSERHCFAKRLN